MARMYMSKSLLKKEDEEKENITQDKMQMGNNLPPFLGGTASFNEQQNGLGIGGHEQPRNTIDNMNPHTTTPNLGNQQGVQLTPELIKKLLES